MSLVSSAREALEQIKQRAFAGEAVTPDELAAAQVAAHAESELSEIVEAGAADREQKATRKRLIKARADAKKQAAVKLNGADPKILAAYDALFVAFDNIGAEVKAYTGEVRNTIELFDKLGIVVHDQSLGVQDPDIDPLNHGSIYNQTSNGTPAQRYGVTVAGVDHTVNPTSVFIRRAFTAWLADREHRSGTDSIRTNVVPAVFVRNPSNGGTK